MELTSQEKMKRVEIAENLLEYAEMMYGMSRNSQVLVKNIFREKEKENKYSVEKFEQIKKHHFFSTVIAAFSFENDEYITNLSLKNIGIDEKTLKDLFVNKNDINEYRNSMTGDIKDHEILKYIRNALNHHENGILYKYIEDENVIEIDLKDVRTEKEKKKNPNGTPKRFHVKVPISILIRFINRLSEVDKKNTQLLIVNNDIDYNAQNLDEEIKNKLKMFRITIKNYKSTMHELEKINKLKLKGEQVKKWLETLENSGLITFREYTYKNGAITDWQIDSICEMIQSSKVDWRVNTMNSLLSYVNQQNGQGGLSKEDNLKINKFLLTRNLFQFGLFSSKRFLSSAIFNRIYLKNWNNSLLRIVCKVVKPTNDLNDINRLEWFILDPLEKVFVEYENFIRYSIVNFVPTYPNHIISFNGQKYDCDFLRNAFAHGRVAYVRKNGQYMFALYDCLNGLHNEVSYVNKKMYIPIELVNLAKHLCQEEKKKLEIEQSIIEYEKRKLIELRKNLTSAGKYDYINNDILESFKTNKK